ncbi:MFS transporter [Actinoplanes sp. NPDC049265]|uniref:MFS transporter n=1 Tax=Actinoplanes sp. NPDC049265 TaxID=3363902 RepID=UPI00371B165C
MVSQAKERRFIAPLLLGSALNPINSSMIATGLAAIAADFRVGPGAAAQLVSVLYLCSAVAQPTMGKLATLFGPRRVFLAGVTILLAGGLLGGFAPSFEALLVARALIGIGTSAGYPTAMALVRRRADRLGTGVPSRTLGNFSIAAQVTIVVGLPLGGLLNGTFGWRGLFLVNVPLALITLAATWFAVERDEPLRSRRGTLAALDLPGIALFAGAIVALLLFLGDLTHPRWWIAGLALVLLAALAGWEPRAPEPLIDLPMLGRNGALQRTYLRQFLAGLGNYTALYGVSQWMEEGAGYSSLAVGLIMLPLSVVSIGLARVASSRGWVRWPLVAGASALIATAGVMLAAGHGSGVALMLAISTMFGVANGFSNVANQAALYTQAPGERIAVAAGLYRTANYLGAIFSASVIGLSFGARVDDAGFHRVAWIVIGIGLAALAMPLLDGTVPTTVKDSGSPERRPGRE